MYGVALVGFQGLIIGFNDQLGLSHTNNPIDNADTYVLDLKTVAMYSTRAKRL